MSLPMRPCDACALEMIRRSRRIASMRLPSILPGLPILLRLFSVAHLCAVVCGAASSAFGRGIDVWTDQVSPADEPATLSLPTGGQISWACELDGVGLGLCETDGSEFRLWRSSDGSFRSVSLAPLGNPVGAFQSAVDGLVYVACFGTHPIPRNDSGLAVVDVSGGTPRVVATYHYPHPHHVHNVYEFELRGGGRPEVFLAILGNPWLEPPVPGHGLVMFDREAGAFVELTSAALNIRSAKQPSPGLFYAVTQEPPGVPTRLVRLEARGSSEVGDDELVVRAETLLPQRDGGDGGADAVLGLEPDTVWVSDRWAGPGRLYYYSFDPSLDAPSGFVLEATHVGTGVNARYAAIANNGDMMVCSEDSGTLTLFHGLALSPTERGTKTTIETVDKVQFFIESDLIPSVEEIGKARIKSKVHVGPAVLIGEIGEARIKSKVHAGPAVLIVATLVILPLQRAFRRAHYSQV